MVYSIRGVMQPSCLRVSLVDALRSNVALGAATLPKNKTPRRCAALVDGNEAAARRRRDRHPCWPGVVTTSPSSSGRTVIWQLRRELGFTSKAKSSMSSSICEGLPVFSVQASST